MPYATLPGIDLQLAGAPLEPAFLRGLTGLAIRRRANAPAELSIRITGVSLPSSELTPGKSVTLAADGQPLFDGLVAQFEYQERADGYGVLTVEARDQLHILATRSSVRAHLDLDLLALANELGRDLGLRARYGKTIPPRRRLEQQQQSDLDVLASAAERVGLHFNLRGRVIEFFSPSGLEDPVVPLHTSADLLEFRVRSTGNVPDPLSVAGWSPSLAREVRGQARSPRNGPSGSAASGGAGAVLLNELLEDERDADSLARAELDRRSGTALSIEGTTIGNPRLEPGRRVRIEGTHAAFNGTYVVTDVMHRFDPETGFVSSFGTAPPDSRRGPARLSATFGVVSRIDDPLQLGRVRVRSPASGDLESDWLAVVTPGAGLGKGVLSLPDLGDRVLVLLLGGESGDALVLGGLYGEHSPPDHDEGHRRFSFVSPGGQRLTLDDQRAGARLEVANGTFLDFTSAAATLHSSTDLVIEAPGRNLTIRAARIDFEQG